MLEVLVAAAPGRGDDYIRLDPTRDMRQIRTFTPWGRWSINPELGQISAHLCASGCSRGCCGGLHHALGTWPPAHFMTED